MGLEVLCEKKEGEERAESSRVALNYGMMSIVVAALVTFPPY
jgi:hypothetical protein